MIKNEFVQLKQSFALLDKRFWHVAVLDILLITLLFSGLFVWNRSLVSVVDDISELRNQLSAVGGMTSVYGLQLRDETAVTIFTKFIAATLLLAIYVIAVWNLMKNWIYNIVNQTDFSKAVFWRFTLLSAVWNIAAFMLFMFLQYLVYLIFGKSFVSSSASRYAVFALLVLIALVIYWLSISLFTHLVHEKKILAAFRGLYASGIKGFGRFLIPLLFSFVVVILVNLVMLLFLLPGSKTLFFILSTLILVLYCTWLRFYYTGLVAVKETENYVHHLHAKPHIDIITRQERTPAAKARAAGKKSTVKRAKKAGSERRKTG